MADAKSLQPPRRAASSADLRSTSVPPGSHERPAQRSLTPGSGAPASLVMQRHAALGRLNHFEVLEVPENADGRTIRRAFQQAVLRFHPDRLSPENERLRPLAKEIVCRIGIALRVLEDDASRAEYLRSLRMPSNPALRASSMPSARPSNPALRASSMPSARPSNPALRASSTPTARPGTPGLPASVVPGAHGSIPRFRSSLTSLSASPAGVQALLAGDWTPDEAFEAAKAQLGCGRIDEAFAFIEQACIAEPDDARYRALHAWLRVERGELKVAPAADEILTTLTWAVRKHRTDLQIRLYRGRVLQRLGRKEEAIRDFSVVASMDEKNLEAVREVRLYRAREEQKAASSGLFRGFFKAPRAR